MSIMNINEIEITGLGVFVENGDYRADCIINGEPCDAYFATAERYDYFSDGCEDCIDWERPYRIEDTHGNTVYEALREDCVQ